jgi:hypothetical protein
LVNFSYIFKDCKDSILDDLDTYGLLYDLNFKHADTKRVFYYYIIKEVCDSIINTKSNNKVVVYYNEDDLLDDNIFVREGWCNNFRFKAFFNTIVKKINTLLPIKIHISETTFNEFSDCFNNQLGDTRGVIKSLNKPKHSGGNLLKIKTFTKKYKLTYLDKDYFNQLKVRSIMYR